MINNKRSYTEYNITSPTTDFAIGFENYGVGAKDIIEVTLNGVLVESLGYTVRLKNAQVLEVTPAIEAGTVRLQRVTGIDSSFHKFTAGALFTAKSMDENFEQIRHSQQEVKDGFLQAVLKQAAQFSEYKQIITAQVNTSLLTVNQAVQAFSGRVGALEGSVTGIIRDLYQFGDKAAQYTKDAVKTAITDAQVNIGFITIDSFELGATITQRNQVLRHAADGKLYRWTGDLPKVVPASSTPANSGGIAANAWLEVSDATLRQDIVSGRLVTDAAVTTVPVEVGAANRNQASVNKDSLNALSFFKQSELAEYNTNPSVFDSTGALQRAIFAATTLGRKINAHGIFKITDTIVIDGSVDLGEATFESYVVGKPAVLLRPPTSENYLQYADIKMPKLIVDKTKVGAGWSSNVGNIGVQLQNLISTVVRFGTVRGFETNVLVTAKNSRGCGYNEFHIGHLDNGKVNLLVDVSSTGDGWCNENNFFGGRFSQNSGNGTAVVGCRHIALRSGVNTVNNNVFYKPSVEGDTPEFQVEFNASNNTIHDGRWECNPPKVLYEKTTGTPQAVNQARDNRIVGGLYADRIVFTERGEGGSFTNELVATGRHLYRFGSSTGGHRYMNGNGAGANVLTVFNPSDVQSIENTTQNSYSIALSSYYLDMKATSDVAPRIRLEAFRGRIYLGDGTATPTKHIGYNPAAGFSFGDGLWTTGGYNMGTTNYKWGNVYLSGAVGSWGVNPPTSKPSVTGSMSDGTALSSLLTALASYGLIANNTIS